MPDLSDYEAAVRLSEKLVREADKLADKRARAEIQFREADAAVNALAAERVALHITLTELEKLLLAGGIKRAELDAVRLAVLGLVETIEESETNPQPPTPDSQLPTEDETVPRSRSRRRTAE